MKNYADLGGCYPPQPSASADNTLLDLHNSSYHTQPHPIIAKYSLNLRRIIVKYDVILDQSERAHLYNHRSNYIKRFYHMRGKITVAAALLRIALSASGS